MDQLAKRSIDTAGKSALKSVKMAKFKSDRLKTEKDMAPQSRKILYTFVWWGQFCAPTIQTSGKFRDFAELYWHINFKLGKLTIFMVLFLAMSINFR